MIGIEALAAYGTYVLADLLHQSGIISVVVAGIVTGTYGRRVGFSARARDAIDTVWEFLAFVLTAIAFQIQHGVNDVFEHLGPRERTLLRNMT